MNTPEWGIKQRRIMQWALVELELELANGHDDDPMIWDMALHAYSELQRIRKQK